MKEYGNYTYEIEQKTKRQRTDRELLLTMVFILSYNGFDSHITILFAFSSYSISQPLTDGTFTTRLYSVCGTQFYEIKKCYLHFVLLFVFMFWVPM